MKTRKPWQRLALSLVGLAIVTVKWFVAIRLLAGVKVEHIASFTTMTTNSDYVTAAIVIFMVTGKLIYDWKNETTTNIVEKGEQLVEKSFAPKHNDDPEIQ
jgi:hypothetical protein